MTSLSSIHAQCDKLIEGPPPSWDQVYAAQRCARSLKISLSAIINTIRDTECPIASMHATDAIEAIRKQFEP